MSLTISKKQAKFLNRKFKGSDLCPECGIETDFKVFLA